MTPNALTIAGSDSGGGAGIQADLKTFSALETYGTSVVCAVTAQNTRAVTAVHLVPPEVVRAQLHALFDDIEIHAIKIGMLGSAELIDTVASVIAARAKCPVVVDPVMVAKSGDRLLPDAAIVALIARLLPLATVVTPNLPEIAALLSSSEVPSTVAQMSRAGEALLALGAKAVLVKGGHLDGSAFANTCVDVLVRPKMAPHRVTSKRLTTKNTHGTGCTLSSAIAARLAHGDPLDEAVDRAQAYLHAAIAAADALHVGSGHGPVHHFHAQWRGENAG